MFHQNKENIQLSGLPAKKRQINDSPLLKVNKKLGLKESKEIVDNVPKVLKEGASKAEADAMKKELEDAGGNKRVFK